MYETDRQICMYACVYTYINEIRAKNIWLMLDSNLRPLEYRTSALPTELISPMLVVGPFMPSIFLLYRARSEAKPHLPSSQGSSPGHE